MSAQAHKTLREQVRETELSPTAAAILAQYTTVPSRDRIAKLKDELQDLRVAEPELRQKSKRRQRSKSAQTDSPNVKVACTGLSVVDEGQLSPQMSTWRLVLQLMKMYPGCDISLGYKQDHLGVRLLSTITMFVMDNNGAGDKLAEKLKGQGSLHLADPEATLETRFTTNFGKSGRHASAE